MVEAASFFFFKTPDDDVREVLGLPLGDDADDEVVEDDAVCSVVDSRSTGTANFPNIFHVLVGLFRFKNPCLGGVSVIMGGLRGVNEDEGD